MFSFAVEHRSGPGPNGHRVKSGTRRIEHVDSNNKWQSSMTAAWQSASRPRDDDLA
jgi:hypothetical protein